MYGKKFTWKKVGEKFHTILYWLTNPLYCFPGLDIKKTASLQLRSEKWKYIYPKGKKENILSRRLVLFHFPTG